MSPTPQVITTPGRLMELIREEDPTGGRKQAMSLDGCRALVMDEVDVLLGESLCLLSHMV